MRIVFGNLDDMISELREDHVPGSGTLKIRVEGLYDKVYGEHGIPFYRFYITVQALFNGFIYCYEENTYLGTPVTDESMKDKADRNRARRSEAVQRLQAEGFFIRPGRYEE